MRSDLSDVSGRYWLKTTESNVLAEITTGQAVGGNPTCYYGIRVYRYLQDGSTVEITGGSAVAIASLAHDADLTTTISATWSCPQTALNLTDRIQVWLLANLSTPPTTGRGSWITEQLNETQLDAALWTVYYRVSRSKYWEEELQDWVYYFTFRHGISGDSSYIANFSHSTPPPVAVAKPLMDGLTFVQAHSHPLRSRFPRFSPRNLSSEMPQL